MSNSIWICTFFARRFVKTPDEEKFYFNIDLDLRLKMLGKFKAAGVGKIFCGHYHRNAGGWDGQDMELVVTSAVGAQIANSDNTTAGHGFRIVKVDENKVTHQYYKLEDVPTKDII